MKKLSVSLIIIVAITGVLFSCHKDPVIGLQNAILTGEDLRQCASCGGVMMTFSNNDTPYHAPFYDVDSFPSNFIPSDTTTYPKFIKVKWHFVNGGNNFVAIDELIFR